MIVRKYKFWVSFWGYSISKLLKFPSTLKFYVYFETQSYGK